MNIRILFPLCLLLLLETALYADDYFKYIRRIFPVDKQTIFFIDSKYGYIDLRQWESDSVLIEASFRVGQIEEWEEETLAGQLGIGVEQWPGTLKVRTEIDPQFDRAGDLKIEMTVCIPQYMVTDIINRYGEIKVPYYNAYKHLSLNTIYGSVEIDTLYAISDVEVILNTAYGELCVKQAANLNIRSAYSRITVGNARNLNIKADKSKFFIDKADTVNIEGEYNLYEIKQKKALTVEENPSE